MNNYQVLLDIEKRRIYEQYTIADLCVADERLSSLLNVLVGDPTDRTLDEFLRAVDESVTALADQKMLDGE